MPRWMNAIAAAVLAAVAMSGGAGTVTAAVETKTAIFAGGCFWCVEDAFDAVDGVTETVSGYAGGTKPNPTYGDHENPPGPARYFEANRPPNDSVPKNYYLAVYGLKP